MENQDQKVEYITRTDLEEQTNVIITAVDWIMEKLTIEVLDELYIVRNELKQDIRNVRDELYTLRDELKHDINHVQTFIDGYVKAQEDFKQELVIMKEELRPIKSIIKDKLGLEIRAI
jgi:hypothetical protein